jgi:hypothetical protein
LLLPKAKVLYFLKGGSFKNCKTIFEIPTGFRFLQSKQTEPVGATPQGLKEVYYGSKF